MPTFKIEYFDRIDGDARSIETTNPTNVLSMWIGAMPGRPLTLSCDGENLAEVAEITANVWHVT